MNRRDGAARPPEIRSGRRSPPAWQDLGRLCLIDAKNVLYVLDSNSGETRASVKLPEATAYTSLFLVGDRIYLRGVEKTKTNEPRFFVAAYRISDGRALWVDYDKEPSVSNFIEKDGRLYFSTPFTLISLDRETGARNFAVRASDVGKSFPVRIESYGESIVYIGELVVAAFDAKSGARIYRHGFEPINQSAHMDALNEVIEKTLKFLAWFTGPWSDLDLSSLGMSGFMFEQAANSQNQSNYHYGEYSREARTYNTTGDSLSASRAMTHLQNSTIDAAFANAQMSVGLAFETAENVQRGMRQATATERERLQQMLRIRRLLYSAYVVSQQGEYVYRPTKVSDGISLKVIHLPTGRSSIAKLSSANEEFGIYNLVDVGHGAVYHAGFSTQPQLGSYLIANPLALPK